MGRIIMLAGPGRTFLHIPDAPFQFVHNPRDAETKNIVSLALQRLRVAAGPTLRPPARN